MRFRDFMEAMRSPVTAHFHIIKYQPNTWAVYLVGLDERKFLFNKRCSEEFLHQTLLNWARDHKFDKYVIDQLEQR